MVVLLLIRCLYSHAALRLASRRSSSVSYLRGRPTRTSDIPHDQHPSVHHLVVMKMFIEIILMELARVAHLYHVTLHRD